MLTEKNFAAALKFMNFIAQGNVYQKIFADNVIMKADLNSKHLCYPAQIKGRDRNNFFDDSHRENLVVFECVNRLLDKGYRPEDIWLEKSWQLGHELKSGRADICVSSNEKTIFIIECKTHGEEFKHELENMRSDGGQLFSYWQQETSCQWLMLYASDFDGELKFSAASVSCNENIYRDAKTVEDRFKIWSERYEKKFLGDVIFHDETIAYKIGVKPLRKRDLKNFSENKSVVNKFEETLRHNNVSDKENAFNRLIALFIAKLVDESRTPDEDEVQFQFKDGSDTHETFQDRLQKLYADGMKKFMGEDIFYLPEDYPDKVFKNFSDEENHENQIRDLRDNFRKLKFYTNNAFAFVEVQNEKLFYLNAKILQEVVEILRDYRIIGSNDLQTLGDLFEQLLNKGFKQNEGQFFTPTPIAQFIWDSLPLDEIISEEPPKIIDYACGAGHFLTEGFKAVNDCYERKNLKPPTMWERDKLFGVEKDYRLARVSKISLFMHGANEGKIKFGDGLENYPDEGIKQEAFDILVANPPYSIKGFKSYLKLANELEVLDKISNDGSEIETLFAERIGQLVKPKGFAAVIRAACKGKQLQIPALEKYYRYSALADMLDFDAENFTKKISLGSSDYVPVKYSGEFEQVKLGEIAPFVTERTTLDEINLADFVTTANMLKDKRGIKTYEGIPQISNVVKFSKDDVLVSNIAPTLKKIWLADRAGGCSPDVLVFRSRDEKILSAEYLFCVLKQDDFFEFASAHIKGMTIPRGDKDKIKNYKFPLPSIEIQEKIIEEFDSIDAQILQTEETIQNLDDDIKNKFVELFIGKNFPRIKLGTIGKVSMCKRIMKAETSYEGEIPFYKIGTFGGQADAYITREKFEEYSKNYPYPKKGDVLISAAGTIGKTFMFDGEPAYFQDSNIVWIDNDEKILLNIWLLHFYATKPWQVTQGGTIQRLYNAGIENILVPVPPLDLQEKFALYVENCEAEKKSARKRKEELKLEREELVKKYFR